MALKCGTYKPILTNIKYRSFSADPCYSKKTRNCQTTVKNYNYENWKYRKCKFGNIRIREKDLCPLGGVHFVETLKKKDEKRLAKIERNLELVKSYQRTKQKSNNLCSEYCGRRKYEIGPLFDKNKDFKITQSNPWCYFKDLKDRDGLKTKGKTDVEQQLNALGKIKSKPVEEEPKIQIEKTEAEKPNNEIINKDIELSTKKLPDLKTTETLTVRPLKKIEKLVENLIRTKFHSLNKQFTLLDPKQTECIDRETFLKLAEKCELELNKAEVDLLWKDFHSESVKFSNLVRRFFLPREFSQIRRIRDKIELEKEIEKNQSTHRTYNSSSSCFSELDDECCHHKFNEKNNSKDNLIQQIKPYVSKNWYTLKQDFQIADFAATGYISNSKAMDVFRKNKIQFNNQELEDLCKNFDIEQNSSKFDYITFMKAVNTNKSINEINKTIPKWNSIHPFFEKIIKKIRENLKEKKGLECNLLLRDLNNLKITFKKYDQASKGHLTIQEFKELIKNCQIDVNSEELYQMFAEYDPYLKGVFCYDVFIKKLIDKSF